MFFRKSKRASSAQSQAKERSPQKQSSTADTAHLVGPGCVKLVGSVPVWQPVSGAKLQLHPEYLRRVLCYGNVDFSTAVLQLLWRKSIQVAFLSKSGHSLLGKLQPGAGAPNLSRLQHLAAENATFSLAMARETVTVKIDTEITTARYFQQQGKGSGAGKLISFLKQQSARAEQASAVQQLQGIEGAAAAQWFAFLTTVIPSEWAFRTRVAHPPTDPVNALLSLGYAFVYYRCETLLAAADLDPRVGFLHSIHPGRSSLACDLVEPYRAPLVDRLVVGLLTRKSFTHDSFLQQDTTWKLKPEDFKRFLKAFEQALEGETAAKSFKQQMVDRIDTWCQRIRGFDSKGGIADNVDSKSN